MNLNLNYEGFEKFLVSIRPNPIHGGKMYRFIFNDKWGASVVKHADSYGHERDLWELAVLYRGELCYSTDITSDVIGWLTDEEVRNILKRIMEL